MPRIKINGWIAEDDFKDILFEWDENSTVSVYVGNDDDPTEVMRLQPDDIMALAGAITGTTGANDAS